MTKDEALKLALEALETLHDENMDYLTRNKLGGENNQCMVFAREAITAIKEALAQPEQEPVVWMYQNKSTHEVRFQKHMRSFVDHGAWYEVPLYSEPLANQEKTSGSPIKEALMSVPDGAQPEQEPVAYLCENAVGHKYFRWKKPSSIYKPVALYTRGQA